MCWLHCSQFMTVFLFGCRCGNCMLGEYLHVCITEDLGGLNKCTTYFFVKQRIAAKCRPNSSICIIGAR